MIQKSFITVFLSTIALALSVMAAINWFVDPYFELGRNTLGAYVFTERQVKASGIVRYSHDAVLLGNSRMTHINPATIDDYRFFNAAFSGASPKEIFKFVEKFVRNEKFVVIGVDVFMLSDDGKAGEEGFDFATPSPDSIAEYLISASVLKGSLENFIYWLRGDQPLIWENGFLYDADFEVADAKQPTHDVDRMAYEMNQTLKNFRYSKKRLDDLARVKNLLDKRGINYRVVMVPFSNDVNAYLEAHPMAPVLKRVRKDLEALFPRLISLTSSTHSATKNFYKLDLHHFRPAAGTKMLIDVIRSNSRRNKG